MTTNNAVNSPLSGTTGTGNFVGSTSPALTTPNLGTPSAITLTNATGLPGSALPAGSLFNFQQGQVTTPATFTPNAAYVDITNLSIAITPTSSSNKVLVRAVFYASIGDANNIPMFQLVRGSTAIGIGTSVGSRTAAGAAIYDASVFANTSNLDCVVLEWLDSPATTSSTTYKVQVFAGNSTTATTVTIGSTLADTNTSAFPRVVSTISVCEVHA